MREIFADLHVHIGRSENGKPIKITGARSLNFGNIAKECYNNKGIDVVSVIDCASPYVIEDIENFLKNGDAYEIDNGGIIYKDKVCIILGSEVETTEIREDGKRGSAHNLCYFRKLSDMKKFSNEMSKHIKNITLSTQHSNVSGYELIDIVERFDGVLIPAHAFTPFKSYYGNCTERLSRIFKEKFDKIFAIELGLSADTYIADKISELYNKNFITNSDAHSLPKIAREYNKLLVDDINFDEIFDAIRMKNGRKIIENVGLDPKLGKYNRSFCEKCNKPIELPPPQLKCCYCGSEDITVGVFDRIEIIKDKSESKSPDFRPNYHYQIPLTFMPSIGQKTIQKLLDTFGDEMTILNKVTYDDLESVVGSKVATILDKSRQGKVDIRAGGGGVYRKNRKLKIYKILSLHFKNYLI